FGLTDTASVVRRFTLKNAQLFDEFPTWKSLMFLPHEQRKQAFADGGARPRLSDELAAPKTAVFHRNWDFVFVEEVAVAAQRPYLGKSVSAVAEMMGKAPLDAFLALSVSEDLETGFRR